MVVSISKLITAFNCVEVLRWKGFDRRDAILFVD